MGILQTAERSSHLDPSENVIYQRHLIAYKEAAKLVRGTVLEVGSGEGYGIMELAPKAVHYIAVDKYNTEISDELKKENNITFIQVEVPPLKGIEDNSVDFVVTFQVIEHIKDDKMFLQEIHRVLKPGGKVILTTPNSMMSLTRNPWHIREYTPKQMGEVLKSSFDNYELKGVFGNDKVMDYYNKNKESVRKITRFDILNFQYWLPRWLLQIPYDILNRFNRHSLQDANEGIVNSLVYTDYSISTSNTKCLDHFCIATK
ncbi:MAG: class I SAM-dependent methyltransferase [Flavobacteriales bacterium]|jgi:ubiquinone/menaquinone biosynthesis C-methylase UbiE|nr:class I SAM-dependent methyltransferase [Flavobacteriales bacterium]MBT5089761.1 class I SAM-dependent methyltransferase [Flavobacteriales bacterium]MBT5750593.1 class I SAM-dependent methyltransferase [Flavobacteriales bacterium]